jgi:tetratricopeptide (TPR) repeat protein
LPILSVYIVCLLLSGMLPVLAQSSDSRKPELIRDTEIAESDDTVESKKPKEPNPALSKLSIDIGNTYFKKKNYPAAIQRYLEALEYQQNSVAAYEALARAYEKNGDTAKAINTCKEFLDKAPNSPASTKFRAKLTKLGKESP